MMMMCWECCRVDTSNPSTIHSSLSNRRKHRKESESSIRNEIQLAGKGGRISLSTSDSARLGHSHHAQDSRKGPGLAPGFVRHGTASARNCPRNGHEKGRDRYSFPGRGSEYQDGESLRGLCGPKTRLTALSRTWTATFETCVRVRDNRTVFFVPWWGWSLVYWHGQGNQCRR